jgi:cation-transporting ATPase F
LADDNFASIVSAVEEGRNMYNKLIKFIAWTLPTNIGEGMVILFAILAGATLPILPVQVLWINMTTAVLLGLMLVFEPKEKGIMQELPKAKNTGIISAQMLIRMIIVGIIMLSAAFSLFEYELSRGKTAEYARTVAVSAFVAIEIFYLFNCRSLNENVFKIDFFSNRYLLLGVASMIILQMIFIYTKFMNSVFSTEPLEADSLLYILLVGIGSLLLIELEKRFVRADRLSKKS